MNLYILVVGIWLLPKADTLQCYQCTPGLSGSCTDQIKDCPTQDNQCSATRVTVFAGGSKLSDITAKDCVSAEQCFEGSVNFGVSKTKFKTTCCTGNLCNTQQVPDSSSSPNGGKCFSCDGNNCTKTLNCEGSEDHCIKATVTVGGVTQTLKGCTSKSVCSETVTAGMTQHIGAEFSCCQGNYCNSASGTSAGPQLLMMSLISLVLFS